MAAGERVLHNDSIGYSRPPLQHCYIRLASPNSIPFPLSDASDVKGIHWCTRFQRIRNPLARSQSRSSTKHAEYHLDDTTRVRLPLPLGEASGLGLALLRSGAGNNLFDAICSGAGIFCSWWFGTLKPTICVVKDLAASDALQCLWKILAFPGLASPEKDYSGTPANFNAVAGNHLNIILHLFSG